MQISFSIIFGSDENCDYLFTEIPEKSIVPSVIGEAADIGDQK